MQREITNGKYLLDKSGKLVQQGWSRSHILRYSRSDIKHNKLRIKERDCYYVSCRNCGLYFSIGDHTTKGVITIVIVDFDKLTVRSRTITKLFPLGKMNMPSSPNTGDVVFNDAHCGVSFAKAAGKRYIKCDWVNFFDNENLYINILLEEKIDDSLNLARDFGKNSSDFVYTEFYPGMTASGVVRCGGDEYSFNPEKSFAFLNWNRGTIPKGQLHQTLFANHYMVGGKQFALCISNGLGNTAIANENALFYDGKLIKLERAAAACQDEDVYKAWKFTESSRFLKMLFKPLNGKDGILKATVDDRIIIFGKIGGELILEDETDISITRLPAIMELAAY